MTGERTHQTVINNRAGSRRSTLGATFYRWTCRCGDGGRWTRQHDTARKGAEHHERTAR